MPVLFLMMRKMKRLVTNEFHHDQAVRISVFNCTYLLQGPWTDQTDKEDERLSASSCRRVHSELLAAVARIKILGSKGSLLQHSSSSSAVNKLLQEEEEAEQLKPVLTGVKPVKIGR